MNIVAEHGVGLTGLEMLRKMIALIRELSPLTAEEAFSLNGSVTFGRDSAQFSSGFLTPLARSDSFSRGSHSFSLVPRFA